LKPLIPVKSADAEAVRWRWGKEKWIIGTSSSPTRIRINGMSCLPAYQERNQSKFRFVYKKAALFDPSRDEGESEVEFIRITDIKDPLFSEMHQLMGKVFPPEEVLAFPLWEEPLKDEGIRVCVAVEKEEVVGATEYRYYDGFNVGMTDFTIIGRQGLGIGPFLHRQRHEDLMRWAGTCGKKPDGMFA
jgi:hypothetical protein